MDHNRATYLRRPAMRAAVLAAMLAAIFVIEAVFDGHSVVFGSLALVPAVAAAFWFGRWAGAGVAALAGVQLAAVGTLEPGDRPAEAIGVLTLLVLGGFVLGRLFDRSRAQTGQLWEQQVRLHEQRQELSEQRHQLDEQRHELDERQHLIAHQTRQLAGQARELEDLRAIQESLTPPELPSLEWLKLANCYLPATDGVAGDFFTAVEGADRSVVIAIGDVAGKGLGAARRAWFVRVAITTAASYTSDPFRLLQMSNHALTENAGTSSVFVTAACLVCTPDGRVSVCLAGHEPPIWLDTGERLGSAERSLPLGIETEFRGSTAESALAPGSGLLLFTDGLTEARPPGGMPFGAARIAEIVSQLRGADPETVVTRLRASAADYAGNVLLDDLSMLALRTSEPLAA